MTKNSRVFSSIFTITIIVLPIIFILGYLLSILLSSIVTKYFAEFSISFTIFAFIFIFPLVFPPPSKKLRDFCTNILLSFWKGVLRLKSTGKVKFDSTIVHFATVGQSTTPNPLDNGPIHNNTEITDITDITHLPFDQQREKCKPSHHSIKIRNYRKIWSLFKKIFFSIFKKNCSISFKNSPFVLIFNSFLVQSAFIKSGQEINGFGGGPYKFRNGTQNQLQNKIDKSIKEVYIWVK